MVGDGTAAVLLQEDRPGVLTICQRRKLLSARQSTRGFSIVAHECEENIVGAVPMIALLNLHCIMGLRSSFPARLFSGRAEFLLYLLPWPPSFAQ